MWRRRLAEGLRARPSLMPSPRTVACAETAADCWPRSSRPYSPLKSVRTSKFGTRSQKQTLTIDQGDHCKILRRARLESRAEDRLSDQLALVPRDSTTRALERSFHEGLLSGEKRSFMVLPNRPEAEVWAERKLTRWRGPTSKPWRERPPEIRISWISGGSRRVFALWDIHQIAVHRPRKNTTPHRGLCRVKHALNEDLCTGACVCAKGSIDRRADLGQRTWDGVRSNTNWMLNRRNHPGLTVKHGHRAFARIVGCRDCELYIDVLHHEPLSGWYGVDGRRGKEIPSRFCS